MHVRLGRVTGRLVLNLQLVKAFALIESIRVRSTSAGVQGRRPSVLVGGLARGALGTGLLMLRGRSPVLVGRVARRIFVIDETFALKEVFRSVSLFLRVTHVFGLVGLRILCGCTIRTSLVLVLLKHLDETEQLGSLDLLGVEVVGLADVEVGNDLVCGLLRQHLTVNEDVVEELLVRPLFKVVHNRHFGRIVLYH